MKGKLIIISVILALLITACSESTTESNSDEQNNALKVSPGLTCDSISVLYTGK